MIWKIQETISFLDFMAEHFFGASKSTLQKWIKQGRLQLNGKAPQIHQKLVCGDEILFAEKSQENPFGLHIYYQDHDLIVVEKPEGLLSVNSEDSTQISLLYLIKKMTHKKVWPVQRLDRETSGVMVFALSIKSRDHLKEQFQEHSVTRRYYAVMGGHLVQNQGRWETFLREDRNYVVHVASKGEKAITDYKVLKKTAKTSHVELTLHTGKKNQIRVQAAHHGHSIVGDPKYQGERHLMAKRLLLHATYLSFQHPITAKTLSFSSKVPF